jgi:uncharacterized damage-inducible protein DinB
MNPILAEIFRHNRWANMILLDTCAELSDFQLDTPVAGTFGTIRSTLVHLVAAQGRYLVALAGWTPNPAIVEDAPFPSFAPLREEALQTSDALIEVAERTTEDHILRGVRGGQPYAIPASVFLIQAINHATEHRAQVATMMAHLGIDAPITDGWAYYQAGQVGGT